MKVLEGKLVATKGKFAIVGARFNEFIVSKLISGAEDTLVRHGVDTDDITLVWVPGAFEIPLAAQKLAQSGLTMLVVTHEMGFAREVSDRICFLDEGTLIEDAPPEIFFSTPKSARAKEFLDKVL